MLNAALLLPEGKPPFIGIFLPYEKAGILNADLILEHRDKKFHAIIEYYYSGRHPVFNLRLICQQAVTVRHYDHIMHAPDKLRSWLFVAQMAPVINFGHVIEKGDKLEIVRTSPKNKPFWLSVHGLKVLKEDQSDLLIP